MIHRRAFENNEHDLIEYWWSAGLGPDAYLYVPSFSQEEGDDSATPLGLEGTADELAVKDTVEHNVNVALGS
eukprot:scaffold90368_cov48-Attheya_sp.AAC.4